MNNLIKQAKQLALDSRDVAEIVEKNHAHLLRDIEMYKEYLGESKIGFTDFFIPSTYVSGQNKELPNYQITKKGCEFIAHKLTGQKGAIFTATYINKFHELENVVQPPVQQLSPQLQLLINMELKLQETEVAITQTKQEIQSIRDTIVINPKAEWRNEVNKILTAIGRDTGDYSKPRKDSYQALESRANCRPGVLVKNLKGRALKNGMASSKVDNLGMLDVLENEPRLREIYVTIVKEMAIKYNVA